MDLRITQVYGRIGIRQYPAKMDIEQPPPRADIRQRRATLEVNTKHAKINIDQSQCFAEAGLKPALTLAHDFYDEGLEAGIEAIGNIVEEANALMEIEKGGNAIADIASSKLESEGELNIVMMPKSRPKIWVDEGRADINWRPNPADIEWHVHTKANIEATRHKVDIYMERWPDIKVEYVGKNLNKTI